MPELLVEDLGRLDLLVAAAAKLGSHLLFDQSQKDGSLGQPERHARGLAAQHEEPQLRTEAAMVAGPGLLDPGQVLLELGPREEGRAIDAGEHLARLVAAPVGPGDRAQPERLDSSGGWSVRATAEISEGAVSVERDGLDALVANKILDQLDLVGLLLGAEALQGLLDGDVGALEGLIGGDVRCHRLLDPLEIVLGGPKALWELEVVVEALRDRRPDRYLRPRPELRDRRGEDVGAVVANELQRLGAFRGQDLDPAPVGKRRGEISHLAVHLDRKRGPCQAGSDRGGRVGAGGTLLELQRRSVGQLHGERAHRLAMLLAPETPIPTPDQRGHRAR
jgi:hypothetical protein